VEVRAMKLATIRCRRRAAALLIASAAVSAGMLAPAGASATGYLYCDYPVAPQSQCPNNLYFTFGAFTNQSNYPGVGTVSVCERVYLGYGTGGSTISRVCGNNSVSSGSDLFYYYDLYDSMTTTVANNSTVTHTIDGYAAD
jgi:hypothetical protein